VSLHGALLDLTLSCVRETRTKLSNHDISLATNCWRDHVATLTRVIKHAGVIWVPCGQRAASISCSGCAWYFPISRAAARGAGLVRRAIRVAVAIVNYWGWWSRSTTYRKLGDRYNVRCGCWLDSGRCWRLHVATRTRVIKRAGVIWVPCGQRAASISCSGCAWYVPNIRAAARVAVLVRHAIRVSAASVNYWGWWSRSTTYRKLGDRYNVRCGCWLDSVATDVMVIHHACGIWVARIGCASVVS
jgi:hypothetical protein